MRPKFRRIKWRKLDQRANGGRVILLSKRGVSEIVKRQPAIAAGREFWVARDCLSGGPGFWIFREPDQHFRFIAMAAGSPIQRKRGDGCASRRRRGLGD